MEERTGAVWSRVARLAGGALLTGSGLLAVRAIAVLRGIAPAAEYWRARASELGAVCYVALGDSAAQGIGASHPSRGYVGVLAERLAAQHGAPVRVVNLSATRARVADVLEGQLPQLEALEPDLVTLAVGSNDAGRTDPERFRAQLRAVLAGLPRGAFVADVPDFQGGGRMPAARALSAVAREEIALADGLVPVPLERATAQMRWRDYAADFFHPADAGHVRWADAFWTVMAPATPARNSTD